MKNGISMLAWLRRQNPILGVYVFLIAIAIGVAVEACKLGLGSLNSPGAGFTYFWTAVLLGMFCVRLSYKSVRSPHVDQERLWIDRNWRQVLGTVVALMIYALTLERLGYGIVTFVFLSFLFGLLWEPPKRWGSIIGLALAATVVSYVVFDRWFALQLPKGVLPWA